MSLARTILRPLTLVALALTLAACGNERGGPNAGQILRSIPQLVLNRKAPPPQITPQQIAEVLANTSAPVALFQQESTKAQFVMLQIERNGSYATFANAARQSIVFRNGMMTASRGLGGDLMSSGSDALLRKVSSRSAGQASYVMRFLTPEDATVAYRMTCAVTRGQSVSLDIGGGKRAGTVMSAACSGDGLEITNTFIVGSNGFILSARQWMGPALGYIAAQYLRT